MAVDHLLAESATGYALYKVKNAEEIGAKTREVQLSLQDLSKFGKLVQLVSFAPFQNAAHALENANDISEAVVHEHLKAFINTNLATGKKGQVRLGVQDKNLAGAIKSETGVECDSSELTQDLLRGCRYHGAKLLKQLQTGDYERAQLGLGHSYSRAKVKFNVNRSDNMIIQAIALVDQLDKDINTFSMRVREWYGWHFPELVKFASDNHQYARLALFIKDKSKISDDDLHDIAAIVEDDENVAKNIISSAKISMGQDISTTDMENVLTFAERVVNLANYRKRLYNYLCTKMGLVAPNLTELIGEVVGARMISHAGSLTNLSKYPASTVQILGAEKALFRALKTKGNTPKYGLIYHSSFIGRAGARNRGRISRFLANKCSIASRIDNFTDVPSTRFGAALKRQVEERLNFYETGVPPTRNSAAMSEAYEASLRELKVDADTSADIKTSMDVDEDEDSEDEVDKERQRKKLKKEEKRRKKEQAKQEDKKEKKDKKDKKEKKEKKDKKKSKKSE